MALEDKNSTWVTEHSCAFGSNGKAYFVSEAAQVSDGVPEDPAKGVTRIFVSNDAGQTWVEAVTTGWADYSTSVVDIQPGPNQNRLYTFFGYFDFNAPDPAKDRANGNGSRIGVITFKDGEQQAAKPIINPNMGGLGYQGSYPQKALLLGDGSVLALYIAALKTGAGLDDIIGAVRMGKDRLTLSDAVTVARVPIGEHASCHPAHFAAAYDPLHDLVYLAYHATMNAECQFILKTSRDGGKTWSEGKEIPRPGTKSHRFFSPAMAVNRNGALGLMWRDEPVSDCWYFSTSLDDGETFSPPQALSQCSSGRVVPVTESSASLRMAGKVQVLPGPSKPRSSTGSSGLGLEVVDSRNVVWRNTGSLTVTSGGKFHAVWIEAGHGEGQLRTATVIVGASMETRLFSLPTQERDARDISQSVAVLYGGDQRYDISTGTLTVDVILKNKSMEPIRGPLAIKAVTVFSEFGKLEIANASNAETGPGAVWDLSEALPNGTLEPGGTSKPYSLVFRLPNKDAPLRELEMLSMQVAILAYALPYPSSR
jgi:hypothetical protein